jgi:hypothetical protein
LSGGDTLCFSLSRCLLCGCPLCGCLRCSYALRFSGGSSLFCGYALGFGLGSGNTLSLGLSSCYPLGLGLSGCHPLGLGLCRHTLRFCLSSGYALCLSGSSSLSRSLCLSIRCWRGYILATSSADNRIVIKRILRNIADACSVLINRRSRLRGVNRRRRIIGGLYGRRRILLHRSSDGLLESGAIKIVSIECRHVIELEHYGPLLPLSSSCINRVAQTFQSSN